MSLEMLDISAKFAGARDTYSQCQSCWLRILLLRGFDADANRAQRRSAARDRPISEGFGQRHIGFESPVFSSGASCGRTCAASMEPASAETAVHGVELCNCRGPHPEERQLCRVSKDGRSF
jgi:hypothetical protein